MQLYKKRLRLHYTVNATFLQNTLVWFVRWNKRNEVLKLKVATLYLVLAIINWKPTNKTPSHVRSKVSVYLLMIQFLSKEGQKHKWKETVLRTLMQR